MKFDPVKHKPDDAALGDILRLIQTSFDYMDARIDPPSSMHRLTVETIADHCMQGEVWSLGSPPIACMFLSLKDDCLYLGKLAVDETMRGKGLGKQLVALAEERARALGYTCLELQTRIELIENHQTFAALGFIKTLETAHEGYDRITSITMRKDWGKGA